MSGTTTKVNSQLKRTDATVYDLQDEERERFQFCGTP